MCCCPPIRLAEVSAIFIELVTGHRRWQASETVFGSERRIAGCLLLRLTEIYLRCRIGCRAWALSSHIGFQVRRKPCRAFKLLLGLGGIVRRPERKT